MPDGTTPLFNHCTRCGDELTDFEAEWNAENADDNPLPPLCRSCFLQVASGVFQPVADLIADFERSVANAFQPLLEAAAAAKTRSDDPDHD